MSSEVSPPAPKLGCFGLIALIVLTLFVMVKCDACINNNTPVVTEPVAQPDPESMAYRKGREIAEGLKQARAKEVESQYLLTLSRYHFPHNKQDQASFRLGYRDVYAGR